MDVDGLIAKLDDLVFQATTERSHFYVANSARQAAAALRELQAARDAAIREIGDAHRQLAQLQADNYGLLKAFDDDDVVPGPHYDELERELNALKAENERLRKAGADVVARWDSPLWKDEAPTAEYIGRLRAALAARGGMMSDFKESGRGFSATPHGGAVTPDSRERPALIGDQVDADIERLLHLSDQSLKDGAVVGEGDFLAQVAARYEVIARAYFASWKRENHIVERESKE